LRTSPNWFTPVMSLRKQENINNGYTLIELMVVVLLIGFVLTMVIPRFRSTLLTDDLKTTTRKILGIIKNLRDDAVREHKIFVLHFDIESNLIWVVSATMTEKEQVLAHENAYSIPSGVSVLDVEFREKGKIMAGETSIRFNKKGYVQESLIHLGSEDDRKFTLVLSPFLGRVEVLEKYVDFNDY